MSTFYWWKFFLFIFWKIFLKTSNVNFNWWKIIFFLWENFTHFTWNPWRGDENSPAKLKREIFECLWNGDDDKQRLHERIKYWINHLICPSNIQNAINVKTYILFKLFNDLYYYPFHQEICGRWKRKEMSVTKEMRASTHHFLFDDRSFWRSHVAWWRKADVWCLMARVSRIEFGQDGRRNSLEHLLGEDAQQLPSDVQRFEHGAVLVVSLLRPTVNS